MELSFSFLPESCLLWWQENSVKQEKNMHVLVSQFNWWSSHPMVSAKIILGGSILHNHRLNRNRHTNISSKKGFYGIQVISLFSRLLYEMQVEAWPGSIMPLRRAMQCNKDSMNAVEYIGLPLFHHSATISFSHQLIFWDILARRTKNKEIR